ncbi:MAG: hypothetical protein HZC52_02075 [Planctomycetes bacterium]|nr:hypothetical protein [Planctomycetota bacterium]
MSDMKSLLDIGVAVVNLVGVPVAIVLFFITKRRERLEREYGTYNSLDEKYIDYLRICVQNPNLDVFDLPMPNYKPTPELRWQELQVFSMLIAILERAYLMYRDKSHAIRQAQWVGWEAYMKDWASRQNFRDAWGKLK